MLPHSPASPAGAAGAARARPALLAAVLAALALVLAGCGSGSGSGSSGASGSDASATGSASAGGGAEGFPVSIRNAFATTTVEQRPERVATLGWGSSDVALALGVVPVAMPRSAFGGDADGILPWQATKLTELGAETPTLYDDTTDGIPFEQVAAARPDVILAVQSGLTRSDYDTLSKIAPVVAYPGEAWLTSWEDQTRLVGQALGREQEAEQLVTSTEQRIRDAGAQADGLAGSTFTFAASAAPGTVSSYVAGDSRVDLLTALGMQQAPASAALRPSSSTTFYADVSGEQLGVLDADVLVVWYGSADARAQLEAQPVFAALPVVRRGAYVALTDPSVIQATSAVSVLSIPYALDSLVPQLQAAAAKG